MSRLVARILLSIFLFPLGTIFYIVVMLVAEQSLRGMSYRHRDTRMFLAATVATWGAVAAYWCLLWRGGVRWNSFRVGGTFLAALGAGMAGTVAGILGALFVGDSSGESFGMFIGGVLAILLWLIATVLIWRESAAERAERIKGSSKSAVTCPTCGYNLTGLSESRCPECGSKFTLDELMAMQMHGDKEID